MRKKDFEEEIFWLEQQLKRAESELKALRKDHPEGIKLYATKHRNSYQFYMFSNHKRSYLKMENQKSIGKLAQIEYDEILIDTLNKSIQELRKNEKILSGNPLEYVADQMNPGKRPFIQIPYVSDEDYLLQWNAQEYDQLGFVDDSLIYESSKGLRVRSKSEIIIANMLDELGIPFLYEKPLMLKNGFVHPDFTLLNILERREVYWEHFGMMDDMDYQNKAFLKIRAYEEKGLFLGDSLIWTFETSNYPLNTHTLRKMLKDLRNRLGYGD